MKKLIKASLVLLVILTNFNEVKTISNNNDNDLIFNYKSLCHDICYNIKINPGETEHSIMWEDNKINWFFTNDENTEKVYVFDAYAILNKFANLIKVYSTTTNKVTIAEILNNLNKIKEHLKKSGDNCYNDFIGQTLCILIAKKDLTSVRNLMEIFAPETSSITVDDEILNLAHEHLNSFWQKFYLIKKDFFAEEWTCFDFAKLIDENIYEYMRFYEYQRTKC